jgi:hypothetical protein
MSDFRLNEQTGDTRHDLQQRAVAHRRDAFNLPMMVGYELNMRHNASKFSQPGNASAQIMTPLSFPFDAMNGSTSLASCSKSAFSSGS